MTAVQKENAKLMAEKDAIIAALRKSQSETKNDFELMKKLQTSEIQKHQEELKKKSEELESVKKNCIAEIEALKKSLVRAQDEDKKNKDELLQARDTLRKLQNDFKRKEDELKETKRLVTEHMTKSNNLEVIVDQSKEYLQKELEETWENLYVRYQL